MAEPKKTTKAKEAPQEPMLLQEFIMDMMMQKMDQAKAAPKSKTVRTTVQSCDVVHKGAEIILPCINGKPMGYDEAIEWLTRKKKDEDTIVEVVHQFVCSPMDGAVAFAKAIKQLYGFSAMVKTPGFFEDQPPQMVGVPISPTETFQVPMGRIEVPGIEGWLETGFSSRPKPMFAFHGEVKKKHETQMQELADFIRVILKEESLYKGKAVKISWNYEDAKQNFNPIEHAPKFLDLSDVSEGDLTFSAQVMNDLQIGLFTPIEHADACRQANIPLKRGVLLYGEYGTGKTMTAYVSAKKAVDHGWTFAYLDNVAHLKDALDFAAQYAPCVLFAEDIDRVMTGERSISMDAVLNTLDGVDTKSAEIITVFTSNHIDKINPATLRMGRLDTLVHVTPPDAKTVQTLVKLYSRGLLDPAADLTKVGEALAGQIPAFIREVTERAKIAAIARTGTADIKGQVLEADLMSAATAMKPHAELLKHKKSDLYLDDLDVVVDVSYLKSLVASGNGNGNG